jgi:hypothetical protein
MHLHNSKNLKRFNSSKKYNYQHLKLKSNIRMQFKLLNLRDPKDADIWSNIQTNERVLFESFVINNEPVLDEDNYDIMVDEKGEAMYRSLNLPPAAFIKTISSKEYSEINQVPLSFEMTLDDHHYFSDCYGVDQMMLNVDPSYDVKVLVAFDLDPIKGYRGSVWIFTHPEYPGFCGIFGIRSALTNRLVPKDPNRSRIARSILHYLQARYNKLIVPCPLPPMIPILQREGFTEYSYQTISNEKKFVNGVIQVGGYFSFEINTMVFISNINVGELEGQISRNDREGQQVHNTVSEDLITHTSNNF